jgi:hypothetical protein
MEVKKMAIIDINRMYREMENTMESNFSGTPAKRYEQAKKLFIESVEEAIENNKEQLLQKRRKAYVVQ